MEQDPLIQKTVTGQVTLRGREGHTVGWGYVDQYGPTQQTTQDTYWWHKLRYTEAHTVQRFYFLIHFGDFLDNDSQFILFWVNVDIFPLQIFCLIF